MPYANAEVAREYRNSYARRWRANNPEKSRLLGLRGRNRAKVNALTVLGGKCVVCGEDDPRLLTVNHINGDGHKERQNPKRCQDGLAMYRAINQGKRDTDDLDVRCFNHNILYEYELGRRTWLEE